jgi:FtsP/CotA-like multicopper oxidase with cupredoxin domain
MNAMKTKQRLSGLFTLVMLASMLTFVPTQIQTVHAAPSASVIYNLFATDGYIQMADGEPVYVYGFVGGRQGEDLVVMPSYDPLGHAQPANFTVPGGAPSPTGGQITPAEAQLAGHAQVPAPVIYASTGDVVEIRLKNLGVKAQPTAPNDPHSIHLHGLDVDAANDGVPETSVGAIPANLCADGTSDASQFDCSGHGGLAPGAGNVVVYMFAAEEATTSLYHCHQEADIHVQMGMYGALVIYNPSDPAAAAGPGKGLGGEIYGFKYDKDVVLLLSEFDVRQHEDEEGTYAANTVNVNVTGGGTADVLTSYDPPSWNPIYYKPQYWLVNGLSFPHTIHADLTGTGFTWTDWLAAHPNYDPFIQGSVTAHGPSYLQWKTPGEKILLRMINVGFETHPMHLHGYHMKVLGSDQRDWSYANKVLWGRPTPFGQGLEKNTVTIGSGETYDLLIDMGQQSFQSTYAAGMETRYDSSTNAPRANGLTSNPVIPVNGDAASPNETYVGGPVVTGLEGPADVSTPAGQYFPFHNHDDYKATNNGAYPGGMFTMVKALP